MRHRWRSHLFLLNSLAAYLDIIHSADGGSLLELPEWASAIKRSVTMVVDGDRDEEEVEEEIRLYWVLYGCVYLCV